MTTLLSLSDIFNDHLQKVQSWEDATKLKAQTNTEGVKSGESFRLDETCG